MAGPFPGGGADRFRQGIRFAMEMAAPPDDERRAAFHFPTQLVYVDTGETADRDQAGVPFDPAVPVRREDSKPPVVVPCAVEYYDAAGQLLGQLGVVTASKVKVLVLDGDHAKIEGCERVVIDGDTYWYRRTEPPTGLFDVGIFELWFNAEQET